MGHDSIGFSDSDCETIFVPGVAPPILSTMEHGIWNMEYGTWNMEHGIWNMEYGIWNMEYGMGCRMFYH
jgi:hypothetical protein